MRQKIDGVVYDTILARRIGSRREHGKNDPRWTMVTLYRGLSRGAGYFLACAGGPMSRYRVTAGDAFLPGIKIVPLSEQQAAMWAQDNLSDTIAGAAFAVPEAA